MTDTHVRRLIEQVERLNPYTRTGGPTDRALRLRDKALISMLWVFTKRATEVLSVRFTDIYYDEGKLAVTFKILKKKRRRRVCPACRSTNALKALYCLVCGTRLESAEIVEVGREQVVVKEKDLAYPYVEHILRWVEYARRRLGAPVEGYLFAPHITRIGLPKGVFDWGRHITVKHLDRILQRLDPTVTSHHFRYGNAEKYLRFGYTPWEVAQIGDWASSKMPEEYARRKGLTPTLEKWRRDIRTLEVG
jgi:integrase